MTDGVKEIKVWNASEMEVDNIQHNIRMLPGPLTRLFPQLESSF